MLDPDTSEPTDSLTEPAVAFCQRVGSKATTVSEIVGTKDEAVYQAIEQGIQRVNRNAAARPYCIQKWAILQRDFSLSGGELGRVFFLACLFSLFEGPCGRAEATAEPGRKPSASTKPQTAPPSGRRTRLPGVRACTRGEPDACTECVLEPINLNIEPLTLL